MLESDYIGISEDRLHHILGVARKAYKIALERGHDKTFATKMFVIGWNHDIGYEFSKYKEEHPMVSAAILSNAFYDEGQNLGENGGNAINAIYSHGLYTEEKTEEWIILNQADMQISPGGKEVSVSQRLNDIKERFGDYSDEYLTACDIAYITGLTAINYASNEIV